MSDTERLNRLLNDVFAGRVVRKDLTQELKKSASVPVYVLEYLLGMYCATDDEDGIAEGVRTVKKILADNYVRPDEAEKVKSRIRETGQYTVIDRVTVKLNEREDRYEASLMNLGLKGLDTGAGVVRQYEKLLGGGIWCILKLAYRWDEDLRGTPFQLESLKPIQMPGMNLDEIFAAREAFTREEWIDVLIRSVGMEPSEFDENSKWHLLARMIPLCENNYNMCELGPRGTGKSHLYKEISPNSILVSGGQTTVANLFYNMARNQVGLVGLYDVVAFDEVAGIHFKDKDGIQIMKDYMASGSFSRGKSEVAAHASMVFVGNIDQVEQLVKTSHLLAPFPTPMIDTAFFDRFHAYLPGWEIPKLRPAHFTRQYGLIVDYLAEWLREMRKHTFSDAIARDFRLGRQLNQRDTIAVSKTVSGLLKLLYPHGRYSREDVEPCLRYALTTRRRIKEQLKKIGGLEFFDVQFSYTDSTGHEEFVGVPEQAAPGLMPTEPPPTGTVYSVACGEQGLPGLFRVELQTFAGNGKILHPGLPRGSQVRDTVQVAFHWFKAHASRISAQLRPDEVDYHLHLTDVQNVGMPTGGGMALLVGLASAAAQRPVQDQLVVLGDLTLSGGVIAVDDLPRLLQSAADAGARRLLLPMQNAAHLGAVPPELFARFQTAFYTDPADGVLKALGYH